MNQFCHLHCHASHSSLDGLGSPTNLAMTQRKMNGTIEECEKRGYLPYPKICLSDHGTIGGFLELIKACGSTKDKNSNLIPYPVIKPIIGNELYCTLSVKEKNPIYGNFHLLAIALNDIGYMNLCELTDKSFDPDNFYSKPRIDFELLEKYNEGLFVSTACLGSIFNANLIHGKYAEARRIAALLKEIFGDRFGIEVQYHGISLQAKILPDQISIAKELDVPIFAANDVHYTTQDKAESQGVLTAMSMKKCIKDPTRMKFPTNEFYLKDFHEMSKIFKEYPNAIQETVEIANRVDSESINKLLFGHIRLPEYKLPPGEKDPFQYLEKLTWEGAKNLGWDKDEAHVERIKFELSEIEAAKLYSGNLDFATYFLHLKNALDKRRESGIWIGGGRGSSYASCVLRTLKINTGPIDPIEHKLEWSRFLGFKSQVSLFDSDFSSDNSIVEKDINIDDLVIENEEASNAEISENGDE